MARHVAADARPTRCAAGAVVALNAWNELLVLQHAPWLGRLLAASILRDAGLTTAAHLAAFNVGLKTIPVDRRRHRDSETRLLAMLTGIISASRNMTVWRWREK
ncbi:Protein of unknown function (DUF1612) [Phyllobacterium sp. YR531]|nr:Protein of unknown function (DUF1612) [Phyllobacterium sp. YR531]